MGSPHTVLTAASRSWQHSQALSAEMPWISPECISLLPGLAGRVQLLPCCALCHAMPCLLTLWVAFLVAGSLRLSSLHGGGLAAAASGPSQVPSCVLVLACGS